MNFEHDPYITNAMRYSRLFALVFTNMLHCIYDVDVDWLLDDPLVLIWHDDATA